MLPANFPRLDDLAFDWRIQAFAIAVSLAAGLGCGLLPALQVARHELVPALVEDALAPAGGGWRTRTARARTVIMAGQVAIASVLLVGALLLVRSFLGLMHADVGYDAANVLTARVVLADGEYSPQRRLEVLTKILERVNVTPGVKTAAFANGIPFTSGEALSSFPVKKRDGSSVQVQTGARQVSPGYFARARPASGRRTRLHRGGHAKSGRSGDRQSGILAEIPRRPGARMVSSGRHGRQEARTGHC